MTFKQNLIALSLAGVLVGCGSTGSSVNTVDIETSAVNTSTLTVNDKTVITSESILPADGQALKQQILDLQDGDTLVVPAGKYADLGVFNISANNVTIKAEQQGTVWFTGSVQINLTGNNITLDGVVFTEGGPAERMGGIIFRGDNNTLQNSTFYYFIDGLAYEPDERRAEYPKYLWISLYGKHNQLLNNTFEGKHKRGTLIGVQKAKGDTTPDHHVIKGNLFYNQKHNQFNEFDNAEAKRYNSNSWEAIRLGDSKSSIYDSKTLIEDNLFLQSDGETELVSLKSGSNIVRGNTIVDSASMISMRHGKNNTVENNVIIGNGKAQTGGIRFYDEGHVIRNNYIERVMGTGDVRGGIVVNTGITDVANGEQLDDSIKGKELNKQATVNNVLVENNTIIDSRQNILYSDKSHRVSLYDNSKVSTIYPGHNVTFRNNLSYAAGNRTLALKGNDSTAPLVDPVFENNLYFGTVAGTELPWDGAIMRDPKLERAENGLLVPTNFDGGARDLTVYTMNDTGAQYQIKK
ncbi:polysaccharide lyase 6 family protein [Photobacterium rosenbergii]|uniref:Polysaccharide lyase 6 family protein n=1 Tax=Photobacterium rosenbergii TaxID=294936 RepID=A0ABU3ZJ23_9GAMM|nr:polysaccharide lyase 6 family protein [Photobacterium rosenbergii]MDV5169973.1 polysaccharide lyase 6 family protein [Photobacterium rosenbergii]